MFSVLGKLKWFFKKYWLRYTIAIILLQIVNVMEVIPPKLLGTVIDEIKAGTFSAQSLMVYIGLFLGLGIVTYTMTYFWMYNLFGGAQLIEKLLRSRFMGHLIRMTPRFYEKNRTGDLMARATNDLKAVSMTTGFGILTLVDSSLFMLTILFSMAVLISWKLTIAAVLPLPLMAVAMNLYGKKIHERFMNAQDSFGDLNDKVLESVQGVRVLRAFVQEKQDVQRFSSMTDDVYRKNVEVAKIDALFDPTIKLLVGMSYMIGLGYGAYLVFNQELTLGELVSFNVYLGMMIWPMFAIGELINIMQRGNASLDRVNETLAYEADVKNHQHPIQIENPETIEFRNVTFQYPSSASENLKMLSFKAEKGETVGIVGKTGSGKTTIIRQLLRQYPLGNGEILIGGVPIQRIPMETLQKWIGYVPQDHVLFSRSVRENILFGKPDGTEEDVEKAIESAFFRKDISMLPEGLNTLVGEKGVALSGGQKQRISIARALIADPEILILDDSLSAVDAKTESAIIENLRRERAGKTTFITTHRLSAVEHADRILVMNSGSVIEEGTHEQLMKNDGWYKTQYERQQIEAQNEGGVGA
ncbi:ABC transporter ATP-binding protein [Metabacillus sp. 84]|uniref:ABC transporter ATP-binding protein n=1 Tax=Metabacillus sp. 84 TaxID=3404705 RepID=UPI003CEEC877